jgi:hypothetical protein
MQKKISALCLIFLMLGLASGFQTAAQWVKYDSTEGRYSVLLPQQPELATQEATSATGDKLAQYRAGSADSDSLYSVAYFDLLPNNTYSLDKGRDGMVNAINGTLISEEAISLGGYAGRELKVAAKDGANEFLIRARLFLVEGRVYVLQHAFLKATDSPAIAAKSTKFFDSFKVVTGK